MGGGCCIGNCGFCCVCDCGFCCVFDFGSSCGDCSFTNSYGGSKVDESKKRADELAKMVDRASTEAQNQEYFVLKQIRDNIENFLKLLEEANGMSFDGKRLNINVEAIRKKNSQLEEEVSGFIGRRLRERLVLTDKEVQVILNEPNEENRKKNFENFYQQILRDAIADLEQRIEETGREQNEIVEFAINNRLAEVKDEMERIEGEYEELMAAHKAGNDEVIRKKADYLYRLETGGILLEQVEKAKKEFRL